MCSLWENKPLMYSIVGSFGLIFVLVTGAMPEFSEQFSVVEFPQEVCFTRPKPYHVYNNYDFISVPDDPSLGSICRPGNSCDHRSDPRIYFRSIQSQIHLSTQIHILPHRGTFYTDSLLKRMSISIGHPLSDAYFIIQFHSLVYF